MRPVNINRLAWVFDQAAAYTGRLPPGDAAQENKWIEEARVELEKYLGRKLRHQGRPSRRAARGELG